MSSTRAERDIPFSLNNMTVTDTGRLVNDGTRAFWLGIATGLRSMLPGALLAWTSDEPVPQLQRLTAILAGGEFIGDKLPFTPSRLSPGPFFGRMVFGAVNGVLVSRRFNQSPVQGALQGSIGAALGSAAGTTYRMLASQGLGIPDFVAALLEDGIAVSLGLRAAANKLPTRVATTI